MLECTNPGTDNVSKCPAVVWGRGRLALLELTDALIGQGQEMELKKTYLAQQLAQIKSGALKLNLFVSALVIPA